MCLFPTSLFTFGDNYSVFYTHLRDTTMHKKFSILLHPPDPELCPSHNTDICYLRECLSFLAVSSPGADSSVFSPVFLAPWDGT